MTYDDGWARLLHGDALETLRTLPDGAAQMCVTSPPYWGLRDYGVEGQLGLEATPEAYVCRMVEVFREVRRVLADDATLWLNIGDSYAGGGNYRGINSEDSLSEKQRSNGGARGVSQLLHGKEHGCKPKDLVGIPWMLAFALRADGWYLRSDIIWSKPNPMPESVTDRPTKAHEYLFLLSKRERYYYDADAIRETATYSTEERQARAQMEHKSQPTGQRNGIRATDRQRGHSRRHAGFNDRWDAMERAEQTANGRNKRTVWTIATEPYPEAHFATFPTALIKPCILAGCPEGGTVLEPFAGSGTTLQVAKELGRKSIGIELNAAYLPLIEKRLSAIPTPFPLEVAP